MKKPLPRNTVILLVCLLIVIIGAVYYFFFFTNDSGAAIEADPGVASHAEMSFIDLASKVDPIVFNTALLSDPRFTSRTDIRTTILPETSGRKDPFAPIGR